MMTKEMASPASFESADANRSRRDSNPRYPKGKTVFKTVAISRSATAPNYNAIGNLL